MRETVAVLRQDLISAAPGTAEELLESTRKLLRRKPCEEELILAAQMLRDEITALNLPEDTPCPALPATGMSGSVTQNERHKQDSDKPISDSEAASCKNNHLQSETCSSDEQGKTTGLSEVLEACTEYQTFFPQPLRNWQDADRLAEKLSPMMGIDMPVLSDARAAMGAKMQQPQCSAFLRRWPLSAALGRTSGVWRKRPGPVSFPTAPMLNALLHGHEGRQIVS